MATTETRPGFRLPWTSDHRDPPRTTDETDATEPQAGAAASDAPVLDALATPDAAISENTEDLVTPTTAVTPTPASSASDASTQVSASAPSAATPASPVRARPTKFLADLTKAMQAAAEAERAETLRQYREDATAYVQQYRADAAERATAYRKEADEDVVGIRDWSKAEMARIREETERRIAQRKSELESELEAHGDRVDRAIQRVEKRIDAYEAEMAAFFERLLAVDDPTAFAAMAANLPEPPPFSADPLPSDAVAVTPQVSVTLGTRSEPSATDADGSQPDAVDAPEGVDALEAAAVDLPATPEAAPSQPATVEAAEDALPSGDAAWAGATWSDNESAAAPDDAAPVEQAEPAAHAYPAGLTEAPVDPRLSALGLTPDFAAAEAEAAVDLAGGDGSDDAEGVIPVDDDALAARIAGLVGMGVVPASSGSGEVRTTQVVVVGLVSVASIAGFKRNLAHVPGVQSVSVSSGPDGEFIFTTTHHDGVDLAAAASALPGFDARVTKTDDTTVHVVAHDPESAS